MHGRPAARPVVVGHMGHLVDHVWGLWDRWKWNQLSWLVFLILHGTMMIWKCVSLHAEHVALMPCFMYIKYMVLNLCFIALVRLPDWRCLPHAGSCCWMKPTAA